MIQKNKQRVFNKLVRDLIPARIDRMGKTAITHTLDETKYNQALRTKLQEEVDEFLQDNAIEELADILEVVYALARTLGATKQELETIRQQKGSNNRTGKIV